MTTRSGSPFGMILDRDLDMTLLSAARRIAATAADLDERRALLRVSLRDHVSEQEANGKTKKCLTRIWLNPPAEAVGLIDWATSVALDDDDVVLQYGALLATFPFAGVVARVIGKALASDGHVAPADVRAEVRRIVGDRPSVDIGARKVYATLNNLGLLAKAGDNLVRGTPLAMTSQLTTWLIDAILHTRQVETIGEDEVQSAPELLGAVLPFSLDETDVYDRLERVTEGAGRSVYVPSRRRSTVAARIVEVADGTDHLRTVIRMAKAAGQTVGFMPDAAYRDRARAGRLLAVEDGNHVEAYVLYDLPRDHVKIVQLVVADQARGAGHARRLVDELCARHAARRGISLRCRNDFPAASVWPRLGFDAVHESIGRSFDGKPLTTWFRDFGHPDLFTHLGATDQRPVAVLDSSAFIALVDPDAGPPIDQLRGDWIGEYARLAVTAELDNELSKAAPGVNRERQMRVATTFSHLAPAAAEWEPWLDKLRAAHPSSLPDDAADLRHIARALAAGATWLIVSDGAMRSRYASTAEELGALLIMRPEQFVLDLDARVRTSDYNPVELAGTSVTRRLVDAASVDGLAAHFVSHGAGEKIGELRERVRQLAAQPADCTIEVIEHDSEAVALVGRRESAGVLEVPLLRFARVSGKRTLARHVVADLRSHAIAADLSVVRIVDPTPSSLVLPAAEEEGYFERAGSLESVTVQGIGSADDLASELARLGFDETTSVVSAAHAIAAEPDPPSAAHLEGMVAPYRIVDAGIETFIVPIRPAWATALFATDLAEGQLFDREWRLGLQRELVYYRSPRNSGGIARGSRILWYVSGDAPGSRSIRAVSLLTEVITAPSGHLFHRFERLGSYKRADVDGAADPRGIAMALRFSNTEIFSHPVPLDIIRSVITGDPKSRAVVLISPRKVSEETFLEIHRLGTSHA